MKILHINTIQFGGAALCAIRINKALVNQGIDSRMLFAEGYSLPEGVDGAIADRDTIFWKKNEFLKLIRKLLLHTPFSSGADKMRRILNKRNEHSLFLNQPFSDFSNIAHHPLVEWADIIHLHWVAEFVDYPSFFKKIKKPIVWTLHDEYPAIGIQHFSSQFSPLPEELKDIDYYCRKIKRKSINKSHSLHIVAISELMKDICKQSDVLRGYPITLIHNGIDTTIFRRYDKQEARKKLGLISDACIFLFSSYKLDEKRKGLDRLIGALESVDKPNKMLVCIGGFSYNNPIPDTSFPVIFTGLLVNQDKISLLYSASDFFLQCSYEECFAQTPLEAMSCGIPVISTPCSGAPDLIRPFNGILCEGFDSESIASGINSALSKQYDANVIRQYIIENYQYDKISQQYIDLYNNILG